MVNIANPFKFQIAKARGKRKIGCGSRVSEHFPFISLSFSSCKMVFKPGAASTVMEENTSTMPKSYERVKTAHLAFFDGHVEEQKKVLSKFKSAFPLPPAILQRVDLEVFAVIEYRSTDLEVVSHSIASEKNVADEWKEGLTR